ncbi:hypothetical protein THRCLA_20593 [Thraustotheca clavata]|uniref:Uncharacterized protein n=1 Tax=Thraustotheca clavata TaxID=74557 RepID=A0A1W0A5G5_9STRA|nr:hypothetical protein THRCLA_20593 [Thraustotheca clavata]
MASEREQLSSAYDLAIEASAGGRSAPAEEVYYGFGVFMGVTVRRLKELREEMQKRNNSSRFETFQSENMENGHDNEETEDDDDAYEEPVRSKHVNMAEKRRTSERRAKKDNGRNGMETPSMPVSAPIQTYGEQPPKNVPGQYTILPNPPPPSLTKPVEKSPFSMDHITAAAGNQMPNVAIPPSYPPPPQHGIHHQPTQYSSNGYPPAQHSMIPPNQPPPYQQPPPQQQPQYQQPPQPQQHVQYMPPQQQPSQQPQYYHQQYQQPIQQPVYGQPTGMHDRPQAPGMMDRQQPPMQPQHIPSHHQNYSNQSMGMQQVPSSIPSQQPYPPPQYQQMPPQNGPPSGYQPMNPPVHETYSNPVQAPSQGGLGRLLPPPPSQGIPSMSGYGSKPLPSLGFQSQQANSPYSAQTNTSQGYYNQQPQQYVPPYQQQQPPQYQSAQYQATHQQPMYGQGAPVQNGTLPSVADLANRSSMSFILD